MTIIEIDFDERCVRTQDGMEHPILTSFDENGDETLVPESIVSVVVIMSDGTYLPLAVGNSEDEDEDEDVPESA